MDKIKVIGQNIELQQLSQSEGKGLWFSLLADFKVYKFAYGGTEMLLFETNKGNKYSPGQLRKIADRIQSAKNCDSVFYFDSLPTFERDRLVTQGVYFIVSDKFAMLPTLIMNRVIGKNNYGERLRPAAQYILLYHIQLGGINGKSFKELEAILPYKYVTIANSVKQLEELGLFEVEIQWNRTKRIRITKDNKNLWEDAQNVLISPVSKVVYANEPISGVIGGTSALSEYSMLAPEKVPTRILTQKQLKDLTSSGLSTYPTEDIQRIEIWSYPPISDNGIADKLSLYLSLKDDHDPRVEKELDLMLQKLW